jgi:hypothetical protein
VALRDSQDWLDFESRTMDELRNCGSIVRGVGVLSPLFLILEDSAFESTISCCISERSNELKGFRYFGVRTIWDKASDLTAFQSGRNVEKPTLIVNVLGLEPEFVDGITCSLQKLTVPAYPGPAGITIDGTRYECRIGLSASMVISWSTHAPPGWDKVADLAEQTLSHFEQQIDLKSNIIL